MPPVSTTRRTTSPRKRGPHGKPPSAGTTSTQSSASPKFERSEQQRQRLQRPRLLPDLGAQPLGLGVQALFLGAVGLEVCAFYLGEITHQLLAQMELGVRWIGREQTIAHLD